MSETCQSADNGEETVEPLSGNDWRGGLGRKWAAHLEALETQWAGTLPLGFKALAPVAGERIVDLGCGGGRTTRALAEAVGPTGQVLGLDVSPDLVPIARTGLQGLDQASVMLSDASSHPFEPGGWDALFSRFGVMFFGDPPAAFTHLHAALRPGGRAVFVVHADRKESPWAAVPARVAAEVLGPAEPSPPGAPGPFGWESPEIFEPILSGAGFREIAWTTHPVTGPMGAGLDPDPMRAAIRMVLGIGMVARRLAELDDEPRAAAASSLEARLPEVLAPYLSEGAVQIGGRIHVISAQA
ncbi:MAG: methyltransferase domain-containing protein [Pseudomonadota bacterium]